jgi:hypothetical protein
MMKSAVMITLQDIVEAEVEVEVTQEILVLQEVPLMLRLPHEKM